MKKKTELLGRKTKHCQVEFIFHATRDGADDVLEETRLISFDTINAVGGDVEAKEILELLQTASVAGFILGSGATLIPNFKHSKVKTKTH